MEVKEIETQAATSHAAKGAGHYQPVKQFCVYTTGLPKYVMRVIGEDSAGRAILHIPGISVSNLKSYEDKSET